MASSDGLKIIVIAVLFVSGYFSFHHRFLPSLYKLMQHLIPRCNIYIKGQKENT